MTAKELDDMPHALRLLAGQIKAPDHVPAMCLRDAAAMIESMRFAIESTINSGGADAGTLDRLRLVVGMKKPENVEACRVEWASEDELAATIAESEKEQQ